MLKRSLLSLLSFGFILQSLFVSAHAATGLEIDNPQSLYVVYTIETTDIELSDIKSIVEDSLDSAAISQAERQDAQLFLRVEQHAGEYLLYLDFSRQVRYSANGKCYKKDGFVWGRYVKDITNTDDLFDDIEFLIDDFVEQYSAANGL